jgi:ankyrin repeat protein
MYKVNREYLAQALVLTARNGFAPSVKMLLESGYADPSELDSEALKWAAANGHTEIVKILLKDGRADPEAVCMDFVDSPEIAELIKNEIKRREALV